MGSPIQAMLGNSALQGQCGPGNNDPILREQLGCPPLDQADVVPGAVAQEAVPQAPSVTEMGLTKQSIPGLEGTLTGPEAAGAQAYQALTPAVEAEQARLAPSGLQQLLLALFGRGGGQ